MRCGNTLLLIRYARLYHSQNDTELLLKQMCTPNYPPQIEYKYSIKETTGSLRILLATKIDAVKIHHRMVWAYFYTS